MWLLCMVFLNIIMRFFHVKDIDCVKETADNTKRRLWRENVIICLMRNDVLLR